VSTPKDAGAIVNDRADFANGQAYLPFTTAVSLILGWREFERPGPSRFQVPILTQHALANVRNVRERIAFHCHTMAQRCRPALSTSSPRLAEG
jgi:hypothetical protein